MNGKHAAVFLDRDGTISEEVNYLSRMEQLRLYPQTLEAIRLITDAGMKAVVVTNQSGIARGYFTEDFVRSVHDRINELLRAGGARIDGFYVCPHHPVYGNGIYKQDCDCRKPKPGLLLQAAAELDIDLARSYMVGDMLKDIEAGKNAGAKGVLVRTGYGVNIVRTDMPAYIAEDVLDAVQWIMRDRKG
ncbi:MAG TPA: HAD family hydrolase [Syntrophales bacterium]|mgnify:FL=1|jgi:D,D-heptose 1,7-bisphosphate phosphatase|nr:HAD family hydrolase [Syntrophales bacterium]